MPSQQGLRRDDGGDLGENFAAQRLGLKGESLALIVIEAQSPVAELLAKNPVLLAKVINNRQLALIHPLGNSDQHKPEWVEDSLVYQSPVSRVRAMVGKHNRVMQIQFPDHTGGPRCEGVRLRSRSNGECQKVVGGGITYAANVLAITTPWPEFARPSADDLKDGRAVVDCWRMLSPVARECVSEYFTVGKGWAKARAREWARGAS